MSSIKLPFTIRKKYGLLISDTDVDFIRWDKGHFERIAIFSNDDTGLERFVSFLEKNSKQYKSISFNILTNIIGEDYRLEKVAHLIGKYKTDFHQRRMLQLFRGVKLCSSHVQGREERGRREDIVLFYGMLTENKVLPWMQAITKKQVHSLEGVHAVAFTNLDLLKKVSGEWRSKSNLLMTVHEKGLLRQTHYEKGHVRFSRVSKVSDESAETLATAIRKELERTIQYLNSLKISIARGLDIQFVCPGNMIGQLRELVKGSDKIRFHFHDASAVAQSLGLQSPLGELGRDSSLSLQVMFSHLWFKQLASLNEIRYYWLQSVSSVAAAIFVLYGLVGAWSAASLSAETLSLRAENSELTERRNSAQRDYDEQFGQVEEPPSSPENITAVSEAFRVLSNIDIVPSQLIYYFAVAYEQNKRVKIDQMRWYVAGSGAAEGGDVTALIQGQDIYQILEVSGEFLPVPNETYLDVANRADKFINSFEDRGDVELQIVSLPQRELTRESLGGVLEEGYNVDAAHQRQYSIRIIWKNYDENLINALRQKGA